jgi:hypothetical protein
MAQIPNRLNQSITIVRLPVPLNTAGSVGLVVGFAVTGRVLVVGLNVFPFKFIISLPSSTFGTPFGVTLPWLISLGRRHVRCWLMKIELLCAHSDAVRFVNIVVMSGAIWLARLVYGVMSDALYSALPQESSGFVTLLIAGAPGQMASPSGLAKTKVWIQECRVKKRLQARGMERRRS